jgi:hypothetical protein
MQLRPIQQLKGLQRLLSAGRLTRTTPPCCASLQQPVVQQWHPPTVSHISSSAVSTKQQPCRNLLQPPSDVSRYQTARYVAVRSSAASGETDSIAAVKRLVSASLAAAWRQQQITVLPDACSTLFSMHSPRLKDVHCRLNALHSDCIRWYCLQSCARLAWQGSCWQLLSSAWLHDPHPLVFPAV